MANVNITIDGKALSVPAGKTILTAARDNGIHIPTLCFLEKLDPHATCRICVVEVEGASAFLLACAAKVKEGMVVHTDTEALRSSRKATLELLLSEHSVDCQHCLRIGGSKCDDLDPKFCEMCFFCDCEREGFCELSALAREYKVDMLPFAIKPNEKPVDESSAIIRNPNRCVKCKRCVDVCGKVQTVRNLCVTGSAGQWEIATASGKPMAASCCIGCGRCVEVCPTGALYAREHKDELVYSAHSYDTTTVAQVSSELLPELERLLKVEHGTVTLEQIAGSLKKLGIDRVLSAKAAEESAASTAEAMLDKALGGKKPVVLTNSYATKRFLHASFPQLKDSFVFYPTLLEAFGELAAAQLGGGKDDVKVFAFGAVGSDAVEAEERENIDIAVNARELYRIMLRTGAEPNPRRVAQLEELKAPSPKGAYGKLLSEIAWSMEKEPEELTVTAKGKTLDCLICRNLGQARKAMEELSEGKSKYDVIRVVG